MADLLDPRQRRAAAILLSAVDLPAPAVQVADLWMAAAKVSPRIRISQVHFGDRANSLRSARDLIDEILRELG